MFVGQESSALARSPFELLLTRLILFAQRSGQLRSLSQRDRELMSSAQARPYGHLPASVAPALPTIDRMEHMVQAMIVGNRLGYRELVG